MIVTKLYLVSGTKNYPAFTGDELTESAKFTVPANSEKEAEESIKKTGLLDNVYAIKLLYEVIEGCGGDGNGVWRVIEGFDNKLIHQV